MDGLDEVFHRQCIDSIAQKRCDVAKAMERAKLCMNDGHEVPINSIMETKCYQYH